MFPLHGIFGLLLILLTEANFFLKIQPFEKMYFPVIWVGYILFVDALCDKINRKSFVKNNLPALFGMFIISAPFWKMFEFINLRVQNWHYLGTEFFGKYSDLFSLISFSIVIPAFFVTLSLFELNIKEITPERQIGKKPLYLFVTLGVTTLILLLFSPKHFFPFEWIFVFFILDPINYYNRQPSILYAFKKRKWKIIAAVALSSLALGLLWEFWNYWASVKWIYTLPFFNFMKIFEMPVLGYFGYIPFGFEIFSFYYFVRYTFRKY